MRVLKPFVALAAVAALSAVAPAQARDVSWSVGIGAPGVGAVVSGGPHRGVAVGGVYAVPGRVYRPGPVYAPRYVAPPVYYAPAPVAYYGAPVYARPYPVVYPRVYRGGWVRPYVRHHVHGYHR